MAVQLVLSLDKQACLLARCDGELLGEAVRLSGLPRIGGVKDEEGHEREVNPFYRNPYALGQRLFAALGGEALLARLEADEEGLLCLLTDEETAKVPWEYAVTAEREFLGCIYGMVRLLPNVKESRPAKRGSLNPLNLVILAADPLVDGQGNPNQGAKLALQTEMAAIREKLRESEAAVVARRVAPTQKALQSALRKGPAILHLSCHGKVVGSKSPQALLSLEDQDGKQALLRGNHLKRLPPRGLLRLVVMSACQTAASVRDADLARALVRAGIPAAIGMQGNFPDALSDEFAATLYEYLLAGEPLSEALRQARWTMAQGLPYAVGLAVAYIAPDGNQPLPLREGSTDLRQMAWGHWLNLPTSLQPPRPFEGREGELHNLAQLFSQGHKVVTVVGTGGIGKSALSAAFAERFGWRFRGGVIGATLADSPLLSPETLFEGLLRRLQGAQRAQQVAGLPAAQIVEQLLAEVRQRETLILLDNYESVLQALDEQPDDEGTVPPFSPEARANAQRLHRLVYQLAQSGATLLLTSRRQPAGLAGEIVFPPHRALAGINQSAGAKLFIHHSKRAKENGPANHPLALQVAEVTDGHPLAIALLAGEWDISESNPDSFLQNWHQELAAAHRAGLAKHHITFATAFERSFRHLTSQQQAHLVALSRFNAPFFAQGAACVWHGKLPEGEAELNPVRTTLNTFVRRSLLHIDGTYKDTDQAATYRLEPVIARSLARHDFSSPETVQTGYHAYATWLVGHAYYSIHTHPIMANLARQWLDELLLLVDEQPDEQIALYCWQLATLLGHFGRVKEGLSLLEQGRVYATEIMLSRIAFEQANVEVVKGNLELALTYYQESLAINEKTGDLQGKSATLHQLAGIYLTRGQLDKAERLYTKSLAFGEQIGALQGRTATLHQLAKIYFTRGQLDKAEALYTKSLASSEQIGDLKNKAATLHNLAQIYLRRGQLDKAEGLYTESLAIDEQIGREKGKADTLHHLAEIYLTRGQLDKAEGLYTESLTIYEQIGNLQGKAATLHQMAQIYLTKGQLNKAEGLYIKSLAMDEKIGNLLGKAATLHQLAQICLKRGQLNKAESLYTEGLALNDKIGNLQDKASTLSGIAQIYFLRGQLDKAERLYSESLAIDKKMGKLQGKAVALSGMADIRMRQGRWNEAERLSNEALRLEEQLGHEGGMAFGLVKLGQVAEARGNLELARQQYQAGLVIFERLGMPEANQVRTWLASLEQLEVIIARPSEELLISLTQAGQRALQGQHKPAELAGTITELLRQGKWQADYVAYLETLAQAVQRPKDALDGLVLPASLLLGKLEPTLAIALTTTLARLFDQQQHPAAIAFQKGAIALSRLQKIGEASDFAG